MTNEPQQLDLEDYIEQQGGKRGVDVQKLTLQFIEEVRQSYKYEGWCDVIQTLEDHGLKLVLDKDR